MKIFESEDAWKMLAFDAVIQMMTRKKFGTSECSAATFTTPKVSFCHGLIFVVLLVRTIQSFGCTLSFGVDPISSCPLAVGKIAIFSQHSRESNETGTNLEYVDHVSSRQGNSAIVC